MKLGTKTSDDPKIISEMFSHHFKSVFEPLSDNAYTLAQHLEDNFTGTNLHDIRFTQLEVCTALKNIDPNKGAGPDKIKPVFLKHTSNTICMPLNIIFNKCLETGTFPTQWKQAYITPIHKSGSKNNVENYRPISILSAIPKIFEKLIHDHIYSILKNTLLEEQHGFVNGRSTLTNLLVFTNFIFNSLDSKSQIETVYTDFKKAFDKVDHLLLLKKISYNGIKGNLLRWFASYLQNRIQSVVLNGYISLPVVVTSGVPQGSILGPLLFILFINDISTCFDHCKFLLYADDLKLYSAIIKPDDIKLIQNDLDRLENYCKINKLFLAYNKCKHITYTRNKNVVHADFYLGGHKIVSEFSIRDLGVYLDTKLTLDRHIEEILNKSYRMLGFVTRITKSFKHKDTLTCLYQSLVRSHLEYVSPVWNPFYSVYEDKIEKVQKKFLRIVNYRMHSPRVSYENLLTKYQMLSLKDRRTLIDATTFRNICVGEIKCSQLLSEVRFRIPPKNTRSKNLFHIPKTRTNIGKRAPVRRMCVLHNKMLNDIDMFSISRSAFKTKLKSTLVTIMN
ncbi:unnamed protein product [Parnassius mnemosyne]|uniref:Reverse transcriptase domain-containing protein n=1 Tax=Parnassius mnemosyne TaxID=213953 RepID=A0AAV1LV32_9NEOP